MDLRSVGGIGERGRILESERLCHVYVVRTYKEEARQTQI